jgi:hypothetical protein
VVGGEEVALSCELSDASCERDQNPKASRKKQVPIRLFRYAQSLRAGSHRACGPVRNDIIIASPAMKSGYWLAALARRNDKGRLSAWEAEIPTLAAQRNAQPLKPENAARMGHPHLLCAPPRI